MDAQTATRAAVFLSAARVVSGYAMFTMPDGHQAMFTMPDGRQAMFTMMVFLWVKCSSMLSRLASLPRPEFFTPP